jgi:hypothetical protein
MKNKIILSGIIALLCGIGIAGAFWGASIAEAASSIWNSCQRGQVNCEYPGICNDYRDTNKDSICDRSQSAPVTTSATQAQAGTTVISAGTLAASSQVVNSADSGVPAGLTAGINSFNNTVTGSGDTVENTGTSSSKSTYYFIPICLALVVFYVLTWILSARGIITRMLHRRIWNVILLVSTVVSALLGLFLILRIDFAINMSLPFNMLFWHVEAGIALGVIALFHIFWHWRYFAKLLKTGADQEKAERRQVQPGIEIQPDMDK